MAVAEMSAASRRELFDVPLHAGGDRIDVRDISIAQAMRVGLTVVRLLTSLPLLLSQVSGGRRSKNADQ
jgi:hypothetical protein